MPNSRRRRFSVQNDVSARNIQTKQKSVQSSHLDFNDLKTTVSSLASTTSYKFQQIQQNISKNTSNLKIVAELEDNTAIPCETKSTINKDVTASSHNIDVSNAVNMETIDEPHEEMKENEPSEQEDARQVHRHDNRTQYRRDKPPRQHRIKVRSPKRREPPTFEQKAIEVNRRSIANGAIDWEDELELYVHAPNTDEDHDEHIHRVSSHSLDDMCRICHGGESFISELGQLISACSCRGTVGRVHVKCLERWLTESGKSRCELCGTRYATRRVHKYGIPRALLMWVLSQNAKQVFIMVPIQFISVTQGRDVVSIFYYLLADLTVFSLIFTGYLHCNEFTEKLMVDSLGIMLMSPLAVLAAWLSGRTLAGLMTQDHRVTPWPLASTFVLACMTLVCYYCWIVSAATRHALGWWIWYRSQYEVRLEFQDNED